MSIPTDHLVGYWKLLGDSQDHSGSGNHGINHGVDLDTSTFEGRGQYVEVPTSSSLDPKRDDFSFCALIHTDQDVDDVHGDIVSKFNPDMRRGFNFSLTSSSGGYNSIGTDRRLAFGIDDAKDGAWKDCGKPSPTNVVLFSLTVFEGSLYASGSNVRSPQEASHVYRYIGGDQWEDCGRLGFEPTQGVGGMASTTEICMERRQTGIRLAREFREGKREIDNRVLSVHKLEHVAIYDEPLWSHAANPKIVDVIADLLGTDDIKL